MSTLDGLEAPVYSFPGLSPGTRLEGQALSRVLANVMEEGKENVVKHAPDPNTTDYISWSKQRAPQRGNCNPSTFLEGKRKPDNFEQSS